MAHNTDRLPGPRDGQAAMAKDWPDLRSAAVMAANTADWGLTRSFFTAFDYADSGKTAYFAVQIENNSKKGELVPKPGWF